MRPLERTLLKSLALVLVVALLAAILFPVFAKAKSCAKCTSTLGRLKQMGVGMLMYADDHAGRFAPRDVWMDAISPYVRAPYAFRYPANAQGNWGYAFNGRLDMAKGPPDPARVPMIYDSVSATKNASDLVTSLPAMGRRRGLNGIAYADGAVRLVPAGKAP